MTYDETDETMIANYENINSKNLCATCWCFCSRYQVKKHEEVGHTEIFTPRWFKDAKTFVKLAERLGKSRKLSFQIRQNLL